MLAAHELKAPLALIRQLALGLEGGDLDESTRQRLVEQIKLTSERGIRLTSDMTMAAHQETLFDLEPLNAVRCCQEVIAEIEPLFRARDRRVELIKSRSSPLLVGHPELLRRILLNFADNALQYATPQTPVRFSVVTRGTTVRLAVRDYGPALPVNVLKHIQDAIGRSQSYPLSSRPHSSGLGIHLANYFAVKMHSQVGIIRHRDGTTFYVDADASRQMALL